MLYIHDTRQIQMMKPGVVLIGKFDGLHRGHRKLITAAKQLCGPGMQMVLFTFSRSPQNVLAGRRGSDLCTRNEKLMMAEELGVDVLIEYPFTDEVRHITADEFLEDILCRQLKAAEIVAGPDCHFGFERRGNIEFLKEHEKAFGYRTHVIEKENYRFIPISSSRIREALAQGHVQEANEMLGYEFGYTAPVEHGLKLGRTLGFPTINQRIPEGKVTPEFGVYASSVIMEGKSYPAISNIGVKPTVEGLHDTGIETCILDYEGNLYDRTLKVCILMFVRPERRFSSLDSLMKQVEKDKVTVRRYFDREISSDINVGG